jgi:hypothetical protein
MSRLLLISCSATKREGGLTLPAIERYDGPQYKVLRKALAEGIEPPCIRILSAAYGLIPPDYDLPVYDAKFTPKSADVMASNLWVRADLVVQLAQAESVFVMMGGLYLTVLNRWAPARRTVPWILATGAPGQRLHMLSQWLRNPAQKAA